MIEQIVPVITFLLGLLVGIYAVFFFLKRFRPESGVDSSRDTLKAIASEAMTSSLDVQGKALEQHMTLQEQNLKNTLTPFGHELEKLRKEISEIEKSRASAYGQLNQKIESLELTNKQLTRLTASLNTAFKSSSTRGRWGEISLKRIVELAGMTEHVDFSEQEGTESGIRPDLIVRMPNESLLAVDSKVPLNAYLEALESKDLEKRNELFKNHALAVRNQVNQLSTKEYWGQFEKSPDFVVMFIPGESFLGVAAQMIPNLIESSISKKVLIATPVTLIALLKSVAYGWNQQTLVEGVEEISKHSQQLSERMGNFLDHFSSIGGHLEKAVNKFNSAVGSYDRRVKPSLDRFREIASIEGKEKPPEALDINVRSLDE